jgi:hypothetical protein
MKFLLKFVETSKYADDAMKGSLYMNPLSYFWHINYGEPVGASNSDRFDLFEGTYLSLNKVILQCLTPTYYSVPDTNLLTF